MDTPIAFKTLSVNPELLLSLPPPGWVLVSSRLSPGPASCKELSLKLQMQLGAFVGTSIAPWIVSVCQPPVSPLA